MISGLPLAVGVAASPKAASTSGIPGMTAVGIPVPAHVDAADAGQAVCGGFFPAMQPH